jgi:hypothetical protein
MVRELGPRLRHLHLADGSGSAKDEHLVPGHGNQPCVELLELLAAQGYDRTIVVEINTRKATSRAARQADLAESLAFTRLHFVAPDPAFVPGAPAGPVDTGPTAGVAVGGTAHGHGG